MWFVIVYCYSLVLNGCADNYSTFTHPYISSVYQGEGRDACEKAAQQQARRMKVDHPAQDIRWQCIDWSGVTVSEDRK